MVKRIYFDHIWWEYIGSHKLSEEDEIARLNEMKYMKELSWDSIYQLYLSSTDSSIKGWHHLV